MANEIVDKALESGEDAAGESGSQTGNEVNESKSGASSVPYDRFKEVVDLKNTFQAELSSTKAELTERSAAIDRLTAVVEARESDAQTIQELRRLAEDPRYRDMVVTLDKAIKGIEEEVATGETSKKDASDQTARLLAETRQEMQDQILDQRAELILARADSMAEKYLANLPEEYTGEDKAVIARLWTDQVDWESVEQSPNLLAEKLAESLQTTLETYGTPRGQIATTETTETKPEPTPEEELQELVGLNWGKMEKISTAKGDTFKPVVSDDEFAEAAARVLKTGNLLRGRR